MGNGILTARVENAATKYLGLWRLGAHEVISVSKAILLLEQLFH